MNSLHAGARQSQDEISLKDLLDSATLLHGSLPGTDEVTVVTVVRDGTFFLQSFLDHHRSIGIERFLFVDDWSEPGFLDLLTRHTDVSVIRFPFRYGENLKLVTGGVTKKAQLAGEVFKDVVSNHLVQHPWTIVLDIDEFLVLHPRFSTVRDLFERFKLYKPAIFPAQMVDMLPAEWPLPPLASSPSGFQQLIDAYPLFLAETAWQQNGQILSWDPRKNGLSQLFQEMKVYSGPRVLNHLKPILKLLRRTINLHPRSDVSKIPILGPEYRHLRSSPHGVEAEGAGPVVVAICHFTMTHEFSLKVKAARKNQGKNSAWRRSQSRYGAYERLLRQLAFKKKTSLSLQGFKRFKGAEDFISSGILTRAAD